MVSKCLALLALASSTACGSIPCDRYKNDQLMFVADLQQSRLEACVQAVKDRMEQNKKMCQEGSK